MNSTQTNEPSWTTKTRQTTKRWGQRVTSETREHPVIALGVALGVGYVLGGGLATRAGRMVLLAGLEYAARTFVKGHFAEDLRDFADLRARPS